MHNRGPSNNSESLQTHNLLLAGCDIHFPHFFQSFYFSFKKPDEAAQLAYTIANICDHQNNMELGLNEVFLNAIEHGNLCINHEEKGKLKANNTWHTEISNRLEDPIHEFKKVEVVLALMPTLITIKVSDQGNGFDWREFVKNPFSGSRAYHGRGLLVARKLCFDDMNFSEKGNEVTCFINRE